ncbi:magnesium transporter [Prolixibacteraceae bacterium JC049]|nr:magnesium transporter [Prolixibacteraceae bacterium JC049]
MNFELTRDYLQTLQELIANDKNSEVQVLIEELHPADIAEIMDNLSIEEAKYIYLLLDGDKASDVLVEIPDDDRTRFLAVLPPEMIASQFIENMDSDDAADVIGELPEELQEKVLANIEDVEQAGDIVDLLNYEEDTAGGLMAKELVVVNENWTVQTCLKEIGAQSEDVDEIYYVYVVDDDQKLKGILSLKKLILNSTSTKIAKIYNDDVISVKTDIDQEEVALVMEKYDLVAIPVVDSIGRLVGRITFDDVVDVMREEAEKDYQMVSGIAGDVDSSDKVWNHTRVRLPWLFIGLLGGILGAQVIGAHEHELTIIPMLAFFIPLIGAMAGNVGVQSSSIVVQSLAAGIPDFESISQKLLKELLIALSTAFVISLCIFIYNYFVSGSLNLTWAVSLSLFAVMIFASLFGTFIPLILNRFKIDPALATGPFITTMNDIIGLLIYFLIASLFFQF